MKNSIGFIFTLMSIFIFLFAFTACDKSENPPASPVKKQEKTEPIAQKAEKTESKVQNAKPVEDAVEACKIFEPPWGKKDWREWWLANPEKGEAWFTETPKKMKTVDPSIIARCTHLDDMLVAWLPMKDLKPFENLTQLKKLDIRFSLEVTDATPLKNLKNLEFLSIWGTSIADLTPLAGLNKLKEINARTTKIVDATPLEKMASLEKIDLLGTPIVDIAPLARIDRMTEILVCSTQVEDLSPLFPIAERLTYLDICNVPWRDFDKLKLFSNLETLKLWGLPIGDLSKLQSLEKLKELDLSGATFPSLTPLDKLKNLQKLWLIDSVVDADEIAAFKKAHPNIEVVEEP